MTAGDDGWRPSSSDGIIVVAGGNDRIRGENGKNDDHRAKNARSRRPTAIVATTASSSSATQQSNQKSRRDGDGDGGDDDDNGSGNDNDGDGVVIGNTTIK